MRMPHVAVAAHAREDLALGGDRKHLMHDFHMAVETRVLGHPPVPRLDLDRLMKILQREGQGMKKPVVRLGEPLAHVMVWQVTVVAHRHMAMARILPGVKVALHHVAIGARRRIVAQVTPALAIPKGERSDAEYIPGGPINPA